MSDLIATLKPVLDLVLDLALPLECGGCGEPGTRWCPACGAALKVHPDQPHLFAPRTDPGVPVFALGRYAGPRRRAIIALKEHGRSDLVAPLARAVALGIHQLLGWGVLELPVTVVPAPTRWSAARRRGGDPVTRIAVAATSTSADLTVLPSLRMAGHVRDSVGLTSNARQRNIAGRVRLARAAAADFRLARAAAGDVRLARAAAGDVRLARVAAGDVRLARVAAGDVLLLDDVVTTGATARESVRALAAGGARVAAVLTVAHA